MKETETERLMPMRTRKVLTEAKLVVRIAIRRMMVGLLPVPRAPARKRMMRWIGIFALEGSSPY